MWVAKLALFLALGYVAVVAALYLGQTALLFPTWLAPTTVGALPASAGRLDVMTPDGVQLRGTRIPARGEASGGRVTLLGFGGNAWNADTLAVYLHDLYPQADAIAFNYRGYAPSGGRPAAAALLADAPVIYDHVAKEAGGSPIIAVGISIGTGVAARLAQERPLAGLILVSPFDSLAALGGEHYPWLPVRWLLRHKMEAADDLRGLDLPVAILAGAKDDIIPAQRTEPVRRAIRNLVFDRTIPDAGHNDLFHRPEFRAAMAEALARLRASPASPPLPRQ